MPRRRKSVSPLVANPSLAASSPFNAGAAHGPLAPAARVALRTAQAGVVLLLLTPFVVTTDTLFPHVVGKALYWRALVEIVFAAWVLLALWAPAYRPPRSWLLGLVGFGCVCSLLAGCFGVSPQRSFWSSYQRMQGTLDAVHMLAFAIVVASLFRGAARPSAGLRTLLNLNLGASAVLGLLAVAASLELDVPFYGDLIERDRPRIGSALGNATYLGAFAAMNGTLALGFLVRSFLMDAAASQVRRWARLFWLATAALNYVALGLTASQGALMGLVGASGFLVFGGLLACTRIRPWWLTLGFVGASALGTALVLLVLSALTEPPSKDRFEDGALFEDGAKPLPVVGAYFQHRSGRSRLAAWQAGLEGFAERPLLGWGPENFIVVFGKFQQGTVTRMAIHDYAHNKLIEEAATKGLLGVASYLGLWLFALYVVLRAAKRLPPPERVLALFVGAALMGYFVQSQTLFDTVTLTMQYLLLICYVAWLEVEVRSDAAGAAGSAAEISAPLRVVVASAAIALTIAGLLVNQRILAAASTLTGGKSGSPTMADIEEGIAAFTPLAADARHFYFGGVRDNWRDMRLGQPAEAKRVLGVLDAESQAAVAAEPENWLLHHYLARTYLVVATTEPGYDALAARHVRRSYELAPKQDLLRALGKPLPRPPAQP